MAKPRGPSASSIGRLGGLASAASRRALRELAEAGDPEALEKLEAMAESSRRVAATLRRTAPGLGPCPTCNAAEGEPCLYPSGRTRRPHQGRAVLTPTYAPIFDGSPETP
jgi:hypothetical protein